MQEEADRVDHDHGCDFLWRILEDPRHHRGPERVSDKNGLLMSMVLEHLINLAYRLLHRRHVLHQPHGHVRKFDKKDLAFE